MTRLSRLADAVPAPGVYVASGISQYTGSAIGVAVLLAAMPGYAAAWWRVAIGAAVICAWRRPWRRGFTRSQVVTSALFGLSITLMNMTFYEAIARIPMGTAVSIEFVGPVATALIFGGGWRARAGVVAVAAGVVSIGGFGLDLGDPTQAAGMAWAVAAGIAWGAYIVGGTAIAHRRSGVDALAVGLAAGALVTAPFVGRHIGDVNTPELAVAALAVGVLASALPFPLEQLAMRRLGAETISLMSAVLPATSVIVGALTLRQVPSLGEACGIVLISCGIALAQWRSGLARGRGR
ncbi:EamA family transporter [Nanchangia anserum]|uniref:EamA family transporter n=1 Tax=Nanchangia anserum TaxID=2692125 RepID=A0A8I0KUA8_9ACTO|nr:EamA family transporter [Nanchangia anserum]MBD3689498.1 EamA family transporter [Nanchangia anserum]QOX81687.1 EamA family transporter [Nanchangia anserum]